MEPNGVRHITTVDQTSVRAYPGHCGITSTRSSCVYGQHGSLQLPERNLSHPDGEIELLNTCLQACSRCKRCRWISYSGLLRDCSWYHHCNTSQLQIVSPLRPSRVNDFVTIGWRLPRAVGRCPRYPNLSAWNSTRKPSTSLVFIRTHKTGSSSLQRLLLRLGTRMRLVNAPPILRLRPEYTPARHKMERPNSWFYHCRDSEFGCPCELPPTEIVDPIEVGRYDIFAR